MAESQSIVFPKGAFDKRRDKPNPNILRLYVKIARLTTSSAKIYNLLVPRSFTFREFEEAFAATRQQRPNCFDIFYKEGRKARPSDRLDVRVKDFDTLRLALKDAIVNFKTDEQEEDFHCTVKPESKMSVLYESYATQKGVREDAVRLFIDKDGKQVFLEQDTLACKLQLRDGDVIVARLVQHPFGTRAL